MPASSMPSLALPSSSSSVAVTSAAAVGALGLSAAAAMGLFSWTNHMPVEGKTVLLTGASEGMGRAAARQLAEQGANVIVVARNVGRLEEVVSELKTAAKFPARQRFTYISADVSTPGYAAELVSEALQWNGGAPVDVVWCVAGMSTPMLWAEEAALPACRRNMDVNFWGAAELSHAVLREWLDPAKPYAEPRHLVFTASVLALFAVVGYAPYNPSKWALRGLADTLAQEAMLYPRNPVRVHVVYPGTILSPGLERENVTKPEVTLQLEKDDPKLTPEEAARRAIRGLQRGQHFVTISFLGEVMRWGVMGGSLRNSWLLDTLGAWLAPIIWFFALWWVHGDIRAYARKHGHPATYPRKVAE